MDIRIIESGNSFLDYVPHIITVISLIVTVVITVLQYKSNITLHKKNSTYDMKKETIEEALGFLDTYISWLDTNSGVIPAREKINDVDLAVKARMIHNKLWITCNSKEIIETYINIIIPDSCGKEGYPVFEKYNEFRNQCRKELGLDEIELPKDKIFLSVVSTRGLNETNHK